MININSNMSSGMLNQLQSTAKQEEISSLKANKTDDNEKLKEACMEFESIFINTILKQARTATQQIGGSEDKSYAREIYEGMQDEEMAKTMAKGEGIGLAKELYRQLSRGVNR